MAIVTIVMSTRNRERLLSRAIDSILGQVYRDWELIVVDDCSEDRTWELLQTYTDKRIRIIRNEVREGPLTRNKYMVSSKGKYIGILDDDDYWAPTFLERLVKAMEDNPWCEITHCDAWRIHKGGRQTYWDTSKGKPFPNILPSTCLTRGDTFRRLGGWDEAFKLYHMEADYYIRCGGGDKSTHIQEPLVYITAGGMSSNKLESAKGLIRILIKHGQSMGKKEKAEYFIRIGLHLIEAGGKGKSWFKGALGLYFIPEALGGLVLSTINRKLFLWIYNKVYKRVEGYE